MIGEGTVAVRILIAAGLGMAIGIERELRDQWAGMRTHILVSVGACLFTLMSAIGFSAFIGGTAKASANADVTRIASQVVVGIGFIGGGTILRQGANVRGLTTAATLWVTAAIGLASAAGAYLAAVVTTGVAVVTLAGLKPLERLIARFGRREMKREDES
ncbi:MAG TPA: MgtC/SapB family protein [Actinomycetota bacterium]|nr:MgtC/SapB family protein [Actinomycetota bacterium]